jgi:hypothetical protein
MPWRPSEPGDVPTLGWQVLDWMMENLASPDVPFYKPFVPTDEQVKFVLGFYRLDPKTGRRKYRRAVYGRPKGCGKSPFGAAFCAAEGLGPVVPDGWDAGGQPVGMAWSEIRTPLVQIAATSEDQTANAWAPLLEMLREGPAVDNYPGLEVLDTFINLPRGRIEPITSAATSREGARPVFCLLDQTESWVQSNGGVRLAATLRRNLGKTGGTSLEVPNAFEPGTESVAESSAAYRARIVEGKAKDDGLLYDHREAPPETDMTDRESLLAGLRVAYGDAAADAGGWVDLDRIVAEIWDPATDPQDARRFYLNQVTHASDSWLSQPEWAGRSRPDIVVGDRELVTVGFDGSRARKRGVTDATALIGCRVSDGHLWQIEVWEQPDNLPSGAEWRVPTEQVDAKLRETFARYTVVGMYADPAKWETYVAKWEADFGAALQVKATRSNPIEWWTNRATQMVQALDAFHAAVVDGEMTHDGSSTLTRHILNARRRVARTGTTIAKEHPDSSRKIDAAVAATLAWQARLDAVAAGVTPPARSYAAKRLR